MVGQEQSSRVGAGFVEQELESSGRTGAEQEQSKSRVKAGVGWEQGRSRAEAEEQHRSEEGAEYENYTFLSQ